MATYTYAQLQTLWLNTAKGSKYATAAWAQLMAAIAMAESAGNDQAQNPSGATGLWQILGAVNASDQSSLKDPTVNAHEALLKLESQGLGAWVTYTNGAYKSYLNSGVNPATLPTDSGTGSTSSSSTGLGGVLGIPQEITTAFSDLDKFINLLMWLAHPSSWMRIGSFFVAMILLVFGIYALMHVGSDQPLVKMPSTIPIPVPL